MTNSSEVPASQMSVGHLGDTKHLVMSALIDQHHSLVFKICMKFLGHRQDAEDATQETFSRFAKYFDQWDPKRPLEPWLAKIAGNRCRSFLASRQAVRHNPIRHHSISSLVEPVRELSSQTEAADQLKEELTIAIATLPEMQQVAFKMFHEEELSYAQISEQIGHPLGTVKTWVHRARQQLIQRLIHRDAIVARNSSSGVNHEVR
jgi:RNA polymerase sigma-70 factor (ECF subfamily)